MPAKKPTRGRRAKTDTPTNTTPAKSPRAASSGTPGSKTHRVNQGYPRVIGAPKDPKNLQRLRKAQGRNK